MKKMDRLSKKMTEEELSKVFENYKNPIYNYIFFQLRNHHESEDILSKTFVKFFKYAGKYQVRKETIRAFLYKIASNLVKDFYRRMKIIRFISLDSYINHDKTQTFSDMVEDKKSPDPVKEIDNKNLTEKIKQIIFDLPEKQKEAVFLRFFEEISFSEIADIQKVSIATALSRVRYGIEKIRQILKSKWGIKDEVL